MGRAFLVFHYPPCFGPGSRGILIKTISEVKIMPITDIDDSNASILDTPGKTVLVEFYNNRCPACRAVQKTLEQFAGESGGNTMVCTVNTDNSPGLVRRFGVMSVPTFLVLRSGSVVGRKAGAVGAGELRELAFSEAELR
jgi:thioredoxin-like negative regulator of GroEL